MYVKRTFYSKPPDQNYDGHDIKYGNHSRLGDNWLAGPTNNLKA